MLKFEKLSKGSMVIDMDDVLVFTTSLWFKSIVDKREIFEPYFKEGIIPKDYSYDDKDFYYPMTRPVYNFAEWLLKEDLSTEDELIGRRFIMEAYIEIHDLYQKVIPTPMVSSLINLFLAKNFNFDKLYVVTRTFEETEIDKINAIKFLFHTIVKDVEIIIVEPLEKKSDAIKDIKKVALIIDDELSNIYDYIVNSENIDDCVSMIPKTGYNKDFDKEYLKKAEDRNIIVQYYEYK